MDKTLIGVNTNVTSDSLGNLYSAWKTLSANWFASIEECWHLREPYYCDGLVRVPVPPTSQGKPVYFTAVVEVSKVPLQTHLSLSSVMEKQHVVEIRGYNEGKLLPAKFVEFIVADREWLVKWMKPTTDKPFEIINIRALATKDVPPTPAEMIKKINSCTAPHYTLTDLVTSVTFWSHYCLIKA